MKPSLPFALFLHNHLETITLSHNIDKKHLNDSIENKIYEECVLDYAFYYPIVYKKHTFSDQFLCFYTNEQTLQEYQHFHYLFPFSTIFYTLYQGEQKQGFDCFLYTFENVLTLCIYFEGELLFQKLFEECFINVVELEEQLLDIIKYLEIDHTQKPTLYADAQYFPYNLTQLQSFTFIDMNLDTFLEQVPHSLSLLAPFNFIEESKKFYHYPSINLLLILLFFCITTTSLYFYMQNSIAKIHLAQTNSALHAQKEQKNYQELLEKVQVYDEKLKVLSQQNLNLQLKPFDTTVKTLYTKKVSSIKPSKAFSKLLQELKIFQIQLLQTNFAEHFLSVKLQSKQANALTKLYTLYPTAKKSIHKKDTFYTTTLRLKYETALY